LDLEVKEARGSSAGSPIEAGPKAVVAPVQVSGKFSHPDKPEVYPTNLEFTNIATEEKLQAAIDKDHYSIQLPNHQSFRMSVTSADSVKVSEVGILVLNTTTNAYSCEIGW
jgi:hypothetical protein